ncbi:MAG: hypothetical protein K2I22_07750 [Lachnospiraceae bacterium]|nr:hypothetical protein [Lachnospiraceae bacterium]
MNKKQLSEHIGNMDDRLVQQAEIIPNYAVLRRHKRIRQFLTAVAALVLMVSSFSAGAIAFAHEIIIEVPIEQEKVVLEEIGLTLILPDSWKGRYEVIKDTFVPYNSTMWEFCVKSIYDAQIPIGESDELLYRGTLFYIFQYADYCMSAEEFEQSGIAGIGRYLFATENATYAIMYATDVEFDPENSDHMDEWNAMEQSEKEIQFLIDNILKD